MPRVTVWLDDKHAQALATAAVEARRRPADQAAIIIERALAEHTEKPKEIAGVS